MPATEQTCYDTKVLHRVFVIAGAAMLLGTLWLLAADHFREWKDYQRTFQQLENRTLASRFLEEQTVNFSEETERLTHALQVTQVTPPSKTLIDEFCAEVSDRHSKAVEVAYQDLVKVIQDHKPGAKGGGDSSANALDVPELADKVAPYWQELLDRMSVPIADVRFTEDTLARKRKFRRADLDAAKSKYDLGVRDGIDVSEMDAISEKMAGIRLDVDALSRSFDDAKHQRAILKDVLAAVTRGQDVATKDLENHLADVDQLQQSLDERTAFGRGALEMPIVDAFGRPLRIDQIWLPKLTLNNNFEDVARFDRCITCHQGIDKTAPGLATHPGYPGLQDPIDVVLAPAESVASEEPLAKGAKKGDRSTQSLYGFALAEEGLIDANAVTVDFVWPGSIAAKSGLARADIITHIQVGERLEKVSGRHIALRYLVEQPPVGQAIRMKVLRGFPNPYSSHPRLDLFVGSLSPHAMQKVGCTICHEGQGSATSFKWASHTPDSPAQAREWAEEYGWIDNHHWIFPMQPERFMESTCLKCHHQVTELEPSERFPDPPAPKLINGYQLVQRYGCFGCHDIKGFDGPKKSIGPDVRNEPAYAAVAQQLRYTIEREMAADGEAGGDKGSEAVDGLRDIAALADEVSYHQDRNGLRHELQAIVDLDAKRSRALVELMSDPGLRGDGAALAQEVANAPDELEIRQKLVVWIEQDADKAVPELWKKSHELAPLLAAPSLLGSDLHSLGKMLADVDVPGRMRKVGPSLRYVASKLGGATLQEWIAKPQDIRPTSKMPQFFGLHSHLTGDALAQAEQLEPAETRAAAAYLLGRSQPFAYEPKNPLVTETPNADRGKLQFEVRGCLACHQQDGTPAGKADHGPNLSELGKKLRTEKGKEWLRSWLIAPDRYHRRTVMPDTFLVPIPLRGDDGKPVPVADRAKPGTPSKEGSAVRMTDPAADIAEYLLGEDWKSQADALPPIDASLQKSLEELARLYLRASFSEGNVEKYLKSGIPERLASSLKGAEVELVGPMTPDKLQTYVGRRTVAKYGCAGCHDIPGFEGAKPIGTTLADWGRKETSKLAFEHILHYVEGRDAKAAHAAHGDEAHPAQGNAGHAGESKPVAAHHGLDPVAMGPEEGYFVASLMHHQREGFLYHKLREPRSYDYEKAGNKTYHERLRMPQFPWPSDPKERNQEIEAIMTFVLGLVAEPPAPAYVFQPDARRAAMVQGEKVLQKFNCAGCHVMELDQWNITYKPGDFEAPSESAIYPFLEKHFSQADVVLSRSVDRQGNLHGKLTGMLRVDKDGDPEVMAWSDEEEDYLTLKEYQDEFDGEPKSLGYNVELWQPTLLEGSQFRVKDPLPVIPEAMIQAGKYYPAKGGAFARLLLPIAVEVARKVEPSASGPDAWAWVPPPLVDQGRKTQEPWLRDFLLSPLPIRPGVMLRMPKFNLSTEDAQAIADYFAARDNPGFPNHLPPKRGTTELELAAAEYQEKLHQLGLSGDRFDDAMRIVINKAGCIACHGVSDQQPEGSPLGNGPNLAGVYRRLKPDYMRRWIAKPSLTLPYTKMQELIPFNPDSPTLGGFELPVMGADGKPVMDAEGNPKTVQLYHGTSKEQLNAVVDLLSNFDRYMESQTSIRSKVKMENPLPGGSTPTGEAR